MNTERITARKARAICERNGDPMVPCPCCGRFVIKTEARSIFDFSVKICKRCALTEKDNPKFNWIVENNFYGNV